MKFSFFSVFLLSAQVLFSGLEVSGTGYDRQGAVNNVFIKAVTQEVKAFGDSISLKQNTGHGQLPLWLNP